MYLENLNNFGGIFNFRHTQLAYHDISVRSLQLSVSQCLDLKYVTFSISLLWNVKCFDLKSDGEFTQLIPK